MKFLGKVVVGTLVALVTLTIVVVGCSAVATAAPPTAALTVKRTTLKATGFHANEKLGVYLSAVDPGPFPDAPYYFEVTSDARGAALMGNDVLFWTTPMCRGNVFKALVIDRSGSQAEVTYAECR